MIDKRDKKEPEHMSEGSSLDESYLISDNGLPQNWMMRSIF
jgi:hypothetical protein